MYFFLFQYNSFFNCSVLVCRVSCPYFIEMKEKRLFVEHQVLHKRFSILCQYLRLHLYLCRKFSEGQATGQEEMLQMILVLHLSSFFTNF